MRGDQKAGTLAGSLPRAISPSGVLTYVAFVRLFLKTALRTRDGSFRPLALLPFFLRNWPSSFQIGATASYAKRQDSEEQQAKK